MKKKYFFQFFVCVCLLSCNSSNYVFVNSKQRFGVDFTKGKWLLNELDCPKNNREALTSETMQFFKGNLNERLSYINDINVLISRKTLLNPTKVKLKELKDGTGFDYFINIVAKKNRDDLNAIGLYEDENSVGKSESVVIVEIYDLNLQQIIYSENVVGSDSSKKEKSIWETKKSDKLIDNINFHKTANRLILGALKKNFKRLKKTSIKN